MMRLVHIMWLSALGAGALVISLAAVEQALTGQWGKVVSGLIAIVCAAFLGTPSFYALGKNRAPTSGEPQ